MFLVRDTIPHEDTWREFFQWRGNASHYNIYVHPTSGHKYPYTSVFHEKEIADHVDVKWGQLSLVTATKNLVKAALKDPLNEWFVLMSESCVPLVPFPKFRSILLAHKQSIINACKMDDNMMHIRRWKKELEHVGLRKSNWRKSAEWFAITRRHATIFANENVIDEGFTKIFAPDEHYLPTLLAYHGLDNETTCTDGFAHVNWPTLQSSHPYSYSVNEINATLFKYLQKPLGPYGFCKVCSGFKELCHFTARKFPSHVRYALLENLQYILSERGYPYTGKLGTVLQNKLRINSSEGKYYLIEDNTLREFPDHETIEAFHLSINLTAKVTKLSKQDEELFQIGEPIASRKDGMVLRIKKNPIKWYIKDGERHKISQLVLETMHISTNNIITLSVNSTDIEQIPVGQPVSIVTDPITAEKIKEQEEEELEKLNRMQEREQKKQLHEKKMGKQENKTAEVKPRDKNQSPFTVVKKISPKDIPEVV